LLFGSWLVGLPENTGRSVYYGGAAFGTAFYGLFFIAGVARTIREKKKFIASDFLILLLNTCLYFGVSLYFLSRLGLESYKGLYCAIMGVIHIVLSWLLFRRQSVDKDILYLPVIMLYAGAALLYISGALEIGYQFNNRFPTLDIAGIYLLLYTWVLISLFTAFSGRLKVTDFRVPNMVLLGLGLVVYLFALPLVMSLQQEMLEGALDLNHFGAHWVGAVVVLSILYRLTELYQAGSWRVEAASFTWAVAIVAVIFLSAEGQMLVNLLFYSREHPLDELRRVYDKTGLPILWGLCSFACMWLGMRHKFRPLRIFSLVLFTITLLKLFLFDIRDIPIAGKIAAFFCLGVLLLVVSFMYQRLKKIIIDNEAKIPE
jgi:cbb3-type cytochrome oxidase subunit 3